MTVMLAKSFCGTGWTAQEAMDALDAEYNTWMRNMDQKRMSPAMHESGVETTLVQPPHITMGSVANQFHAWMRLHYIEAEEGEPDLVEPEEDEVPGFLPTILPTGEGGIALLGIAEGTPGDDEAALPSGQTAKILSMRPRRELWGIPIGDGHPHAPEDDDPDPAA